MVGIDPQRRKNLINDVALHGDFLGAWSSSSCHQFIERVADIKEFALGDAFCVARIGWIGLPLLQIQG